MFFIRTQLRDHRCTILEIDLVTTLNLQISGGQLLPGNQPTCAMLQSAAEAVVESSTDSVEPSTDFGCANGFISSSLALFDPRLQTILSTDAAHYALGAVLTQIAEQGTEQTIAFASRSLSEAERKYSIVEKEVLALRLGCRKWRTWLWDRKFILRTDHQALTTLLGTKGNKRAGLRVARWSARLLEFNYDVQYRKGTLKQVADCLSRLLLTDAAENSDNTVESVAAIMTYFSSISKNDFKAACRSCPELTELRTQLQI